MGSVSGREKEEMQIDCFQKHRPRGRSVAGGSEVSHNFEKSSRKTRSGGGITSRLCQLGVLEVPLLNRWSLGSKFCCLLPLREEIVANNRDAALG